MAARAGLSVWRTHLKYLYHKAAQRAEGGIVANAEFKVLSAARVAAELFAPRDFQSHLLAVSSRQGRGVVSIWGNNSCRRYIEGCLKRCGLNVGKAEKRSLSRAELSVRFVWHNRLLSRRFRARGWIVVPGLVRSVLDLSGSWEDITARFSRSARRAVRRIEQDGLRYRILRPYEWLRSFYNEMYLPYCRVRFGEEPVIKKFEFVRALAEDAALLIVGPDTGKRHLSFDEAAGAVLIRPAAGRASLLLSGIRGPAQAALKQGVVEALYYFAIVWAHQEGFTKLDMGLSHGFLADGVLRFKSKWGAKAVPDKMGVHNIAARFERSDWLARDLLACQPLIVLDGCELSGLVYLCSDGSGPSEPQKLARKFRHLGLRQLLVVSEAATRKAPSEGPIGPSDWIRLVYCYDLRYLGRLLRRLTG